MNIQLLVSQVETLFSLPEVVMRLNEVLSSSEPSNDELESIIASDPAFTAKILKIVNSAYFGFPGTIDSIPRAISFIGLNQLRHLALATSVTTSFKDVPAELIDMEIFWYHSVTSGVLAKVLGKALKQPNAERLFIIGLLLGIGKLIYFTQCPEISKEILAAEELGEATIIQLEREKLGFSHAELGAEFLKQWKLPANIWQVVADHLDPLNTEDFINDACIIHVASQLASSIEPSIKHGFDFNEIEPNISPEILNHLKLTSDTMQDAIDESLIQIFDVLSIITPK